MTKTETDEFIRIEVKLRKRLLARLDEQMRKNGLSSRSETIRHALQNWLESLEKKREPEK